MRSIDLCKIGPTKVSRHKKSCALDGLCVKCQKADFLLCDGSKLEAQSCSNISRCVSGCFFDLKDR